MVYGELGRVSLFHTVEKRMINFVARSSQSVLGKSNLSSMIYKLLRCLHDKDIFNLVGLLK